MDPSFALRAPSPTRGEGHRAESSQSGFPPCGRKWLGRRPRRMRGPSVGTEAKPTSGLPDPSRKLKENAAPHRNTLPNQTDCGYGIGQTPTSVSREKAMGAANTSRKLRSQQWFDNPDNPGMTALYMERYLNYGLTRAELQAG